MYEIKLVFFPINLSHVDPLLDQLKCIYTLVKVLTPNMFNQVSLFLFNPLLRYHSGLEKVSVHSNPKERQCQRMLKLLHNCTHLTCY